MAEAKGEDKTAEIKRRQTMLFEAFGHDGMYGGKYFAPVTVRAAPQNKTDRVKSCPHGLKMRLPLYPQYPTSNWVSVPVPALVYLLDLRKNRAETVYDGLCIDFRGGYP